MEIQSSSVNAKRVKVTSFHILPCKLNYDGPAKISDYFLVQELPNCLLDATFRGRKLAGVKKQIPDGYHGVLLRETNKIKTRGYPDNNQKDKDHDDDDGEESKRMFKVEAEFEEVTVWGHDHLPAAFSHSHLRTIEMIDLLKQFHSIA